MAYPTYFIDSLVAVPHNINDIKDMFHEVYEAISEYDAYYAEDVLYNIMTVIKRSNLFDKNIKIQIMAKIQIAIDSIIVSKYINAHNNVRDAFYML